MTSQEIQEFIQQHRLVAGRSELVITLVSGQEFHTMYESFDGEVMITSHWQTKEETHTPHGDIADLLFTQKD